ncbi:hypothetical protein EW145_g6205 [Phellinidium pouzarii]|uniref:Uncharacterized protein n=1 Tax=Phellinidium pouzarii TaxID=167371 RepID=A0A4S4L213_9AGAM|nr:hypothetical protein EW145_g6205 [Phellinidium pouzarii]
MEETMIDDVSDMSSMPPEIAGSRVVRNEDAGRTIEARTSNRYRFPTSSYITNKAVPEDTLIHDAVYKLIFSVQCN